MSSLKSIVLILCLGMASTSVLARGTFIINPNVGANDWQDNVFTIYGNTITFDDNPQATLNVQGLYVFDFGLAVGAELSGHTLDIKNETAGGLRGKAHVSNVTAITKYHFRKDNEFQPFIGLGLGVQVIDISDSNTNARLEGYTVQANTGFIVKFNETIGMNLEYKTQYFSADDENNAEIKNHGHYFGGGITIHF